MLVVAESIKECLQKVLVPPPATRHQLKSDDYSRVECHHLSLSTVPAVFSVYAPAVFSTIRTALGVTHQEFSKCVAPNHNLPYLR